MEVVSVPKVSVLMPVYQGERFVSRAIESVLSQTHPNIELVIVNDGSRDNSASEIRPYLSDSRVRYVEQQNQGVAAARNTALRHSTGTYVGLCDQDDEWLPEKASAQVHHLECNLNVGLVHGDVEYIDSAGRLLPRDPHFPKAVSGNVFPLMFCGNPVMAVAAMTRRCLIEELGGFDPAIKYSDDYDLWLRIAAKHQVGYLPQPLARYRWHESNNSHHQLAIREYTFRVLQKAEKELPGACASVPRNDRALRYFRLHQQMARHSIQEHKLLAAVGHICRSASWDLSGTARELIPKRILDRASWYWSRLRSQIR